MSHGPVEPDRPRVAIIGASRDRRKYGNKAVRAHLRAGYVVYPVNPNAESVEGLPAFSSLAEVPSGPLERVSLYVPPERALAVLEQAAARPVAEVWLNPGTDSADVLARAEALGLPVVRGCSILDTGERPDRL
jgi:predicted CoA-binding protein